MQGVVCGQEGKGRHKVREGCAGVHRGREGKVCSVWGGGKVGVLGAMSQGGVALGGKWVRCGGGWGAAALCSAGQGQAKRGGC